MWLTAVVAPAAAGGVAWVWMGASTTLGACPSGAMFGPSETASYLVLGGVVVAAGLGVVWSGRQARVQPAAVALAALVSVVAGLVLAFVVANVWWSAHGCMS